MTRAKVKDAVLTTFIGLAVVAAWGWGGNLIGWIARVNDMVQDWPGYKETIDENYLDIND